MEESYCSFVCRATGTRVLLLGHEKLIFRIGLITFEQIGAKLPRESVNPTGWNQNTFAGTLLADSIASGGLPCVASDNLNLVKATVLFVPWMSAL